MARALVQSEALQRPRFLFFRGRRAVLLADGRQGTMASIWTGHALAWVNLGNATSQQGQVAKDKAGRTVSVTLPRGTTIDVVKLRSSVNILEGACRLIFTQNIGEQALESDAPRVELTYGSNARVVSTKTGVKLKLTDAGTLNVSSPGRTLEEFADGYLLEWDGPENLLDGLRFER